MQEKFDICIIGGGILGCMAARELSRYELGVVLLEKNEDVCCGITKANSAVIYAGYDHKPGTHKSSMCVRGNERMQQLCEELDVPFQRPGSLMVGFGRKSEQVLKKKLEQGRIKKVPGLELLSGEEVRAIEPLICPDVSMGLYAPTTGTVLPWELGIAAYENALANGCEGRLHTEVLGIRRASEGLELEVKDHKKGTIYGISVRGILNCAGIHSPDLREMLLEPSVRIRPGKAEYLVFSSGIERKPKHILFYEPEEEKKGLTVVPTMDGNLLVGATEGKTDSIRNLETTEKGLWELRKKLAFLLPEMDFTKLIRSFAGIRLYPYDVMQEDKSIRSFILDQPEECREMVSLIGIKTPGLTCSQDLTEYAIEKLFSGLGWKPEKKEHFHYHRKSIHSLKEEKRNAGETGSEWSRILCHCKQVTEGEIREAVRRGADTVEGISHRCGNGMGYCQGSRCREKILSVLKMEQERRQ